MNLTIAKMYEKKEFTSAEVTDPKLKKILEFALACQEIARGDLLNVMAQFSAVLNVLESPLEGTVAEALLYGG